MTSGRKRWIEIGIDLSKDPGLKFKCPECGIGEIRVNDVKDIKIGDMNLTDRYLICDNCNKWNVITGKFLPDSH